MKRRIIFTVSTVIVLLALSLGYRQLATTNDRVAAEILQQPQGQRAARTLLLTLQDGRRFPVNYLWEDGRIYLGIDGLWWRAFVDAGQTVELYVRGQGLQGHARVILNDAARVADVFSRLRPTAPAWLPAWLNGKLVEINLLPALQQDAEP